MRFQVQGERIAGVAGDPNFLQAVVRDREGVGRLVAVGFRDGAGGVGPGRNADVEEEVQLGGDLVVDLVTEWIGRFGDDGDRVAAYDCAHLSRGQEDVGEIAVFRRDERVRQELRVGLGMVHGAAWVVRFKAEDIGVGVHIDLSYLS